jgi:hypothetical protein
MASSASRPAYVLGVIGALLGGVAGYYIFFWIVRQGFYAVIIPSAVMGLVGGYAIRGRSVPFAMICGFAGLTLALFTEWRFAPFMKDPSLPTERHHVDHDRDQSDHQLQAGPRSRRRAEAVRF